MFLSGDTIKVPDEKLPNRSYEPTFGKAGVQFVNGPRCREAARLGHRLAAIANANRTNVAANTRLKPRPITRSCSTAKLMPPASAAPASRPSQSCEAPTCHVFDLALAKLKRRSLRGSKIRQAPKL